MQQMKKWATKKNFKTKNIKIFIILKMFLSKGANLKPDRKISIFRGLTFGPFGVEKNASTPVGVKYFCMSGTTDVSVGEPQ